MKKITTKLLKIFLVITLCFTTIFNSITVQAIETIKNLMDSNNIEKVYSAEFVSEEDAINARNDEISKHDEIKTNKSKEGISYLYYVSKIEKNTKTVPTTEEDFTENIIEYSSEDIIKTKEELKLKEQTLIDSYEQLNDENNIYHVSITSEFNNPVKVGTKFNPVTYDTLEEAVKAIGNKNLTPIKVENEEDNQNMEVNENCTNKTECENKLKEIKDNENNINVSLTVKKNSSTPIEENVTIPGFETKSFDNATEANEYANNLKNKILKYIADTEKETDSQKIVVDTVSLDNLDNILTSKTETIYNLTNVSGTYKDEEKARQAAINYINELKENNSKIDVEKSKENITINSNKVETVNIDELFEYRDDALEYFNNLTSNEYTYKNPVITAIEVSNDNNNNNGGNNTPNITNKTWWHLDIDSTSTIILIDKDGNYIDTVDGDVLITKASLNNTKSLSYPTEPYYDTNRNSWEFRSGDSMNLVKDGDQLKLEGTISYIYNGQTKTVPFSYAGQILSANNLCKMPSYGYDMSISGITVDTDDNAIVEVSKKYKLSYDKYNYTAKINLASDKTTYTVTHPTITKTTTNYSYKLVGNYTVKGYDYTVEYPEDIMEDRYSFDAIISHNQKPATKEVDFYQYYVQTMEITEKGGDDDNKETQEQPPKTGNTTNYINIIIMGLLVAIKKLFN